MKPYDDQTKRFPAGPLAHVLAKAIRAQVAERIAARSSLSVYSCKRMLERVAGGTIRTVSWEKADLICAAGLKCHVIEVYPEWDR